MIECTIYFEDGEYLADNWSVGKKIPFSEHYLARAVRADLHAYGEEYDYIFDRFRNIPIPPSIWKMGGNIRPRDKSVRFYGDMALFILRNL